MYDITSDTCTSVTVPYTANILYSVPMSKGPMKLCTCNSDVSSVGTLKLVICGNDGVANNELEEDKDDAALAAGIEVELYGKPSDDVPLTGSDLDDRPPVSPRSINSVGSPVSSEAIPAAEKGSPLNDPNVLNCGAPVPRNMVAFADVDGDICFSNPGGSVRKEVLLGAMELSR